MLAAALMVRIVVPMGYMPGIVNGAFVMQPCSGQSLSVLPPYEAVTLRGNDDAIHETDRDDSNKHSNSPAPCTFSILAVPSLAGADPLVLATALAFIIATLFRAVAAVALRRSSRFRPPPQGPPRTT